LNIQKSQVVLSSAYNKDQMAINFKMCDIYLKILH